MDVMCQYQQIIIHGAANKGECVILVVRNIQLVYMVIKVVRKTKMQRVATHRSIALWHVQQTKMKSKVVSMCVLPVNVKCNNSKKEFRTHAMLDCGSQGTFISTDLARKLKAESVQTAIKIKTLNGEESQETEAVSGLKVAKSSGKRMWIDLPVTYMKEDLPVDDEDVATPEKIRKWKYLERIAGEITQGQGISIGLLIGGNCSKALEPLEVIPSEQGGPYAFKTLLRWCIVGAIGETTFATTVACSRISVQDKLSKNVAPHFFARETEVGEDSSLT